MPDYSNGKIYKIHSHRTDLVYIGSTTQTLSRRLSKHKSSAKCRGEHTSKSIIEYGDAMITLIETYPCTNKTELESRERYFIDNNECVNKYVPTRTRKQYYDENRSTILQKKVLYHAENRTHNNTRTKEWRLQNKEYIKQFYKDNKDKNKSQRQEHYRQNAEYIKRRDYWRRGSPIGILARAYFE